MRIEIKRIDKDLPFPDYESDAACFDFACREDMIIAPNEIGLVPLNVVIRVPDGFALLVFARSSTSIKKGLVLSNGVGVVDPFYRGDKDEIIAPFLNITKEPIEIKRGDYIAQGMFIKRESIEWEEVESMDEVGRGGYNSDLWRTNKR